MSQIYTEEGREKTEGANMISSQPVANSSKVTNYVLTYIVFESKSVSSQSGLTVSEQNLFSN